MWKGSEKHLVLLFYSENEETKLKGRKKDFPKVKRTLIPRPMLFLWHYVILDWIEDLFYSYLKWKAVFQTKQKNKYQGL